MKFRAVMIDAGPMREFTNIVSTMSKLCKECVLRISETHLYCIVSEQTGPAPPLLWCVLPQQSFFSEFQMVGLDEEYRDIYLSFISGKLCGLGLEYGNTNFGRKIVVNGKELFPDDNYILLIKRLIESSAHICPHRGAQTCGQTPMWEGIRPYSTTLGKCGLVEAANLAKSLSTLKSAKSLKLKLTKKQCPCLTLEIELNSATSMQTRHVTHDIPVTVVPRKLWFEFKEPDTPRPDITIELPPLKQLRTVVDRMRSLSTDVTLRASADGRLTLQISSVLAKVSTRFTNLRVEQFDGPIQSTDSDEEEIERPDNSCHCRIDAKKLSMFLSADQISHKRTMCSIVHKKLVVLTLESEDNVKLQCFIGGIYF